MAFEWTVMPRNKSLLHGKGTLDQNLVLKTY